MKVSPGFLKFFWPIVKPSFCLLACCPFTCIGGVAVAAAVAAGGDVDDASLEYGSASPKNA